MDGNSGRIDAFCSITKSKATASLTKKKVYIVPKVAARATNCPKKRGNEETRKRIGEFREYSISVRATGYRELSGKSRQLGDFVLSKRRKQRSGESYSLSRGVCEYARPRSLGRTSAGIPATYLTG